LPEASRTVIEYWYLRKPVLCVLFASVQRNSVADTRLQGNSFAGMCPLSFIGLGGLKAMPTGGGGGGGKLYPPVLIRQ
jgi:hypothetical protein